MGLLVVGSGVAGAPRASTGPAPRTHRPPRESLGPTGKEPGSRHRKLFSPPRRAGGTLTGTRRKPRSGWAPADERSTLSDEHEGRPDDAAVQLLTPEGERVEHPDYAYAGDDEQVRDFYARMVLVRRVDAEAIALQRQGELGLWPSLLGQEGAQIGAAFAMRTQDYAFPTYREHGITISRGIDPLRLLAMFRGIDPGSWDIEQQRTHLYSIIIGTQGVQATGYGMGLERDGLVGSGDPERDAAVMC